MIGQPFLPHLFRPVRFAGLAAGLLLSFLAAYDWAATALFAVRRPLGIVPDSEFWTAGKLAVALARLGLPNGAFSAFALAFSFFFSVAFLVCGWLIILRRRRDWFGLYLGLILLGWADGVGVFYSLPEGQIQFQRFKEFFSWIIWPGLFLVLYFFPSGHITPRWSRWFALLLGSLSVYGLIVTGIQVEPVNVVVGFSMIVPSLLVGGYAQVYRYRHAGPVERQQVKWVVLALLIYILFFISLALLINVFRIGDPETSSLTASLLASMGLLVLGNLVYLGLPVSITFAMMRYRLWDVDVIIRRTLQYSVLTGALVMLYFGGVVIMQEILGGITGDTDSPVVTVITTLLVAALFNPLRNRTQVFIDRRFYRSRYDAEQILSHFAQTVRDEVDLDRLVAALANITETTMQPQKSSIWIRVLPGKRSRDNYR